MTHDYTFVAFVTTPEIKQIFRNGLKGQISLDKMISDLRKLCEKKTINPDIEYFEKTYIPMLERAINEIGCDSDFRENHLNLILAQFYQLKDFNYTGGESHYLEITRP